MVWQLAVGSRPSLATRCIIGGASDSGYAVITSSATLQTQLSAWQTAFRRTYLSPRLEQLHISDGGRCEAVSKRGSLRFFTLLLLAQTCRTASSGAMLIHSAAAGALVCACNKW